MMNNKQTTDTHKELRKQLEKCLEIKGDLLTTNTTEDAKNTLLIIANEIQKLIEIAIGSDCDIENNPNYTRLLDYVNDAINLSNLVSHELCDLADEIRNFESETDLSTYLENFVYDDTEFNSIEEYLDGEFEDSEEFYTRTTKEYFAHNIDYCINNLLDELG
jgi:hypothetical protein